MPTLPRLESRPSVLGLLLRVGAVVCLALAGVRAQGGPTVHDVSLTWDDHRGVVVCICRGDLLQQSQPNSETWEWDGTNWTLCAEGGPAAGGSMTHDTQRQRCVYVTGNQTWEWDGQRWDLRLSGGPGGQVCHHELLGQTILFNSGLTAEWDGSNWQTLQQSGPPVGPMTHSAYDRARAYVVVVDVFRTHEWDGQGWTLHTSGRPSQMCSCTDSSMAFDSGLGRVIVNGGHTGAGSSTTRSGAWSWDGATWVPAPMSLGRTGHHLVMDRARNQLLSFAGATCPEDQEEPLLLAWSGGGWGGLHFGAPMAPASMSLGNALNPVVYDEARSTLVMVAGASHVWEHDGVHWARHLPVSTSVGRATFDPVAGAVLMISNATYYWIGGQWVVASNQAPPGRVAFDRSRGVAVVLDASGTTWEWSGASWTQAATGGPQFDTAFYGPPRIEYDQARSVCMVVGPAQGTGIMQTWERSTGAWTLVDSGTAPPDARSDLVYDSQRGEMWMHDGSTFPNYSFVSFTWFRWTGSGWLAAPQTPGHIGMRWPEHDMAFDRSIGRIVSYGGPGDFQWCYHVSTGLVYGTAPREFLPHGRGCEGSAGRVRLIPQDGMTGRPGQPIEVLMDGISTAPGDGLAALVGGYGPTDSLDLSAFGMPRCFLRVPLESAAPIQVSTNGEARWSIPVPNVPGLIGVQLQLQGVCLDQGANPGGLVTSNQGTFTIRS